MSSSGIFQTVRKILDENGYRELLAPECVPLVKHLFCDLSKCQHYLKEKKASLEELQEKHSCLELSLGPFQEENGRLLTQLNRLHMENLQLREFNEKVHKEHENALNKLVKERQDLEFVVEELKRRVSVVEKESQRKTEQILLLQEKNLKAVVTTPGGSKKPIASQRQRMEITSLIQPNAMTSHGRCAKCGCCNQAQNEKTKNKDLYLADLLRITDKKLMTLQAEVEEQKQNAFHSHQQCSELKMKISNRDAEIARLQSLLEGGRSVEAVLEDNKLMAAHSQLHQLKLEVEHLTKTNTQLELKLKSVLGDTHEAMSRAMQMASVTKDLETELHNAATTNRLLKEDSYSKAENLSAKLARNEEKLKYCKGDLQEQHSLYHATRSERDQLKVELTRLKHTHSQLTEEMKRLIQSNAVLKEERAALEEVLAKGQGERKSMADRINTLTVQLQESEMERRRLQSETTGLRSTIASLETKVKEFEASQEVLKGELEKVSGQKRDSELEKALVKSELIKMEELRDQLKEERNYYKDQAKELEEQKAAVEQARDYFSDDINNLQMQILEIKKAHEKIKEQLEETSDALNIAEKERDHYSEQVVQLLDILKAKPSSLGAAHMAKSKMKPEEELGKALYEKDVLQQELNFYKTQLQGLKKEKTLKSKVASSASTPDLDLAQPKNKETAPSAKSAVHARKTSPPASGEEEGGETVDALRSERDYLRGQMEHFQHLYSEAKAKLFARKASPPSEVTPSPSASAPSDEIGRKKESSEIATLRHELQSIEKEKEFFQEQYERLKNSLAKAEKSGSMDSLDVENLVREKKVLKQERDFYQKQYKELSAKISEAVTPPSTKPQSLKRELDSVLAEKRSLALTKARLEAQIVNLKEDVSYLERENREANASAKALTKAVENLESAAAQKFPPSMQNFIGEIRKSRDAALEEAEKARQERDQLKGKLKVLSAQQIRDKSEAQEDFSALKREKKESDELSAELQERLQSQANLITSLQGQMQALQEALQLAQSELGMSSKQSDQFRKLLEERAGQADSQGLKLVSTAAQLSSTQARVEALEGDVARLEEDVAKLEAENGVLRRNMGKLDTDKDHLNTELDNKAELISSFKADLKRQSSQIASLEAELAKREATIESCEMTIELEQRKYADETKRCDRLKQDLAVTTEQRDAATREIRRLQKEVAGLTQDVRELQAELERTKSCRENFKRKAQEYCRTLESISISVTNKDKEQDILMQEYLSLNETISSLKMLNASLEESAANQNQELSKMEEMLKTFKEEREQLILQVNESLSKNEELESVCHCLEEEKFGLENNLLTTRDLAQKVEMKRSEAECEVKRLSASLEKIREEKRSLEQQVDSLSSQLHCERSNLRSLEEMLTEKRKAEFVAETSIQQLQVEKTQLQRRVSELTSDLECEVSEVKKLRSKCATLELEAERLRRQLTTEQYERERTAQELRRVRKFSEMEGALALGEGGESGLPSSSLPQTEASTRSQRLQHSASSNGTRKSFRTNSSSKKIECERGRDSGNGGSGSYALPPSCTLPSSSALPSSTALPLSTALPSSTALPFSSAHPFSSRMPSSPPVLDFSPPDLYLETKRGVETHSGENGKGGSSSSSLSALLPHSGSSFRTPPLSKEHDFPIRPSSSSSVPLLRLSSSNSLFPSNSSPKTFYGSFTPLSPLKGDKEKSEETSPQHVEKHKHHNGEL